MLNGLYIKEHRTDNFLMAVMVYFNRNSCILPPDERFFLESSSQACSTTCAIEVVHAVEGARFLVGDSMQTLDA